MTAGSATTGRSVEKALIRLYAEESRKRFTPKDISTMVANGYEPGRIDFPVTKRDMINRELESLETRGYIELKKDRKEKAFTLYGGKFTEKMENLCLRNGIRTKACLIEQERQTINKITGVRDIRLAEWLRAEAGTGNFVRKTFPPAAVSDFPADDFTGAVLLADEALSGCGMVYERNIAKKVLNDSKGITRSIRKILERILTECSDDETLEAFRERKTALGPKAQILPLYGVVKTPEYIITEGDMTITLRDGEEISTRGLPYAFSSEYLDRIESIRVNAERVVTIENLTSYEDFHDIGTVKIYTGGFVSFPERSLLAKVYEDNPDREYLHWSDIDCGGIRIFRHIRNYIPTVMPYRMDISTLKDGKEYWTPLTDNDRKYLESCTDGGLFHSLAEYMLEQDAKLEQESFYA